MKSDNIFNEPIAAPIRVWHWLNSLLISLLLATVVIGFFFLKTRINAPIVLDELAKQGVTVSEDVARSVAKKLSKPIWKWHTYFGYALSILLVFRIVYEFYTKRKNRLSSKLEGWRSLINPSSKLNASHKHYLWVKLIYVGFYVCISFMMVTGLTLAFDDALGISKEVKEIIKDVHYYIMYSVIAFIVAHVSGLTRAEVTLGHKGIVSGMIHGNPKK